MSDNLISPVMPADIGKKPKRTPHPRARKAHLDRHVTRHVAHVKAGKAPPGPSGPLTPAEERYVHIETQKKLAKMGPAGPRGPVMPHLPRGPHLGPHGAGPIGLRASRNDRAVSGNIDPLVSVAQGLAQLGPILGKPLYNAGNAAIHGRRFNAKEQRDADIASETAWQLSGIPTLSHPIRSGLGADALALAGIFPFGKLGKLAEISKAGEAVAKVAPESRIARGLEARRAKKALIRGPRRTESQAAAHVAERNKKDAAELDRARAKGERGGPLNILKPGEVTPETGGVPGQIVRHAMDPDLKGAGKYEKVGARLDAPALLRKEQEALRAPDRSSRASAIERAAADKSGIDKLIAAKSVLKGAQPSVEYRGLAKLTPELRDEAIDFIFAHPRLGPYEKVRASEALDEALNGKVPTVGEQKLLERVFGREAPDGLIAQAKKNGWGNTINDVLGISRALRSSIDFSFPMRQGAVALAYNPRIWLKTYWPGMKLMGSEKGFQTAMKSIEEMPSHPSAVNAGVAFTDIGESAAKGAPDIYAREEAMPSNYAERIPVIGRGVRASDRGYVGVGNLTRAHLYDYMIHKAAREGFHLTDDLMKDIAKTVNGMTGRGDIKWLQGHTATLNALLFSPRLLASRVNFLNPLWYARLSPFARKEAMKAGSRFFGALGLSLLAVEELAGGTVGWDPRSADFGKIKIGDTRIDLGAGFSQLLHLYGQFATQQRKSTTTGRVTDLTGAGFGQDSLFDVGLQFLENKTNPIVSAVINAGKGNQFGQPLDYNPNPLDTNSLISNLWEPMSPQDALSTYQQTGNPAAGIGAGLLAATGVGVQSYGAHAEANSPDKVKTATAKAITELQNQMNTLNVPPKWRAVYVKGVKVKVQRDLAKDQARKVSKTLTKSGSGTISAAESYKITMQTLRKNGMVTPAQYQAAVSGISKMTDRELEHWEYEAWYQLGPGKLLEEFHHYYNVTTGK